MTLLHSASEALARFNLIKGKGDGETTACVMSAISWMTGEAWTDSPSCAHPILRSLAIRANDAAGTTPDQRAEILRAGETGLIDTWWIPAEVIVAAHARPTPAGGETLPDEPVVDLCLRVLGAVTWWKEDRRRASLGGADLGGASLGGASLAGADLGGADLGGADLGGANLTGAYLYGANLAGANLTRADLTWANLYGANLTGADLTGANLTGANLTGANLGGANLTRADLTWANLAGANLAGADLTWASLYGANLYGANLAGARCDRWTRLPDDWQVDESPGLIVRAEEVSS